MQQPWLMEQLPKQDIFRGGMKLVKTVVPKKTQKQMGLQDTRTVSDSHWDQMSTSTHVRTGELSRLEPGYQVVVGLPKYQQQNYFRALTDNIPKPVPQTREPDLNVVGRQQKPPEQKRRVGGPEIEPVMAEDNEFPDIQRPDSGQSLIESGLGDTLDRLAPSDVAPLSEDPDVVYQPTIENTIPIVTIARKDLDHNQDTMLYQLEQMSLDQSTPLQKVLKYGKKVSLNPLEMEQTFKLAQFVSKMNNSTRKALGECDPKRISSFLEEDVVNLDTFQKQLAISQDIWEQFIDLAGKRTDRLEFVCYLPTLKASLTRRILTRAAAFTNVLHLITLVLGFMSWQYGEDGSSSVYFNYWVLGIAVSQVFGAIINISAALSFVNHILMQLQMRTRRSWYHIVSDSHGNRLLVTVAINFYLLYSIILPMVDRSKQLSAIASHMGPWATLCEFCVFVSSSYSFTERMLRKRDDGFEKELKSIFRSTIQQS
ncbi:hypothetical protein EDD86DRAFT_247841 [Gorgonomyces haynaldii]|nr:hypothetical protein EDD86DRAFT_247841 [Gorgonomyces haynaldii]